MKTKQWLLKLTIITAISASLASTCIAANAVQRDWDDHGRDSRELRRDYEKLRDVERKIDRIRRELREAEWRRDWRKVHRLEDEIARLQAERRRIEREIERDRHDRDRYDRDHGRGDRR